MRILEQQFLSGPNLYAPFPCVRATIAFEDADLNATITPANVAQRIAAMLPAPARWDDAEEVATPVQGAGLLEVIEQLCCRLQLMAGAAGLPRLCGAARAHVGVPVVVFPYLAEPLASRCLALAVQTVQDILRGAPLSTLKDWDRLAQTDESAAFGLRTTAILAAARRRGIPCVRLAPSKDLFQLGWGSRQRRLQATFTGKTSHVAAVIASDGQLARQLLAQAGFPVLGGAEQVPGAREYDVLVAGRKIAAACCRGIEGAQNDVTDLLPEPTSWLCVRAAQTIGLDIAGIRIVCADIGRPLREQGGGIIGINPAPDIGMYQDRAAGTARDAGEAIVDAMFGLDKGRIPLIAVTGTNGKTTTTRLIEHALRERGLATGMTTTEGAYILGRRTFEGDCSGHRAAIALLSAPDVDVGVLETARSGILKHGLPFDRCDVSVVLNVMPDELGQDGVDTLADLAEVMEVVARAATRAVVLNADDEHSCALHWHLDPAVELLYFSLDADNPVLLRHLAGRGRGVYLDDSVLILADCNRHRKLLDIRDMPIAHAGAARHNIANALAAAAALVAAGFDSGAIMRGLRSFQSDGTRNPLRANVFDIGGATVIIDHAHNAPACGAIAAMARGMTAGKIVGVIAAPPGQRDVDVMEMGRACAAGFDSLIVYETDYTDQTWGAAAHLLLLGAREICGSTSSIRCIPEVGSAVRCALQLCGPGDLLVLGCGASAQALMAAIKAELPDLAERISAEVA